jgi:uncharacterized protein with beta-barrel porin domain
LAVQRTCGQLIAIGEDDRLGAAPVNELWRRCNELVATANSLNTTPGGPNLGYTDDSELLAAFQQVSGEESQASATMATTASNEQFSTVAARLGALRGATSASVTSVTAIRTDFMYGSGGGAAADASGLPFGPWGWFVRGTITTGDRDPSDPTSFKGEENGFDFDQYGLTFGIDHNSGAAVWGLALGYSNYEVTMNDVSTPNDTQTNVVDGGTIKADSINGTFYFDHNSQNDVYFSALAGYGNQSFDMARNFIYFSTNADPTVNNQTRLMSASPDGDSLSGSLSLGRVIDRGGFIIDPYIGVTYDRITIESFAEVDSGNTNVGLEGMQLAFDEQTIDSLRTNVGVQLSNTIITKFGSVRPIFSADWYHEFKDDPRTIKVKYALEDDLDGQGNFIKGFDGCVSCFNLQSEAPDTDYFVVGLGIAAAYQGGFQAFLMLEGLLGYENLSAYSATIGLRGQF